MAKYGLWLSYNNQEEGFELPILPGKIVVSGKGDGAGYDVYGLGRINVIRSPALAEYSFEGLLPAHAYPFITAAQVFEPIFYITLLKKWRATRNPIRFVYVGATMDINEPVSIESFEWSETAGDTGDIQFSLGLKEYRFYAAQKVQVVLQEDGSRQLQAEVPVRVDDRIVPTHYTVRSGDTLWAISRKVYGTPDRQVEIKELNGLTDAEVKSLAVGTVLMLPKATAHA